MVGFPTDVIVRLPPVVRESTSRPAISSLKFPKAVLGTRPAIKLSVAGVQVGVNGSGPFWFAVKMTSAARVETETATQARKMRLVAAFNFVRVGFMVTNYARDVDENTVNFALDGFASS